MTRKYSYLYGRLRQMGMTQKDIGRAIGLCQTAVSARFNGNIPWTCEEMYQLLDICHAAPEEMHLFFPRNGKAAEGSASEIASTPRITALAELLQSLDRVLCAEEREGSGS